MIEYLIRNALIVDGTGSGATRGTIGICEGKIVLPHENCRAMQELDASNLVLTPGFIDVHGHSDLFACIDPLRESKLCQGITTEIAGQCGISPAPMHPDFQTHYYNYYQSLGAPIYPNYEKFLHVGALLDFLEEQHMGINMALCVAQGSLRIAAMGLDPRPAQDKEIQAMQHMAIEAVEAGAFGISTGLMYAPGSFCSQEEITQVCRALSRYGCIYSSHIRNQGNGLLSSVGEALSIASESNLKANISHHKAVGRSNWGRVRESAAMIHAAGAMHDIYPYEASSTTLSATIPPSYLKLGMKEFLTRLKDPSFCEELHHNIFNPIESWDNDLLECGYDGILIISAEKTPSAIGCTIASYAQKLHMQPFEAYINLLLENEGVVSDVCFSMSKADVDFLVADDECMFGTDSLYVPHLVHMTHPRAIGAFPKILGEYVRERKILTLEKAIRKMTFLAAQQYGLKGKGIIAEGMDADIVLFDPRTIGARSTYAEPLLPNSGIEYVFVQGGLAVKEGKATGFRGGKVLRKGR